MKKSSIGYYTFLIGTVVTISFALTNCIKNPDSDNFPQGTFPDTVLNLNDINSVYDDYNTSATTLDGYLILVYSSKRKSLGKQFDLEQAYITYMWDKTNGDFRLGAYLTYTEFLDVLINKAQTPRDDLGPYRFYSAIDGYEYMVITSVNEEGNMDLFYLKNRPSYSGSIPDVEGKFNLTLFNTDSDDGYLCFDTNLDSAYFMTNINGNFDIFLHKKPADNNVSTWFDLSYAPSTPVDSINSSYDDKCPIVFRNIMVFTSNRPGGYGGYDLYYSLFKKGKWNTPVNFGPRINTESHEYRPIIGFHPDFTNNYMIFSSNKPGGIGGYDLYITGVEFPE
jgi:hypothetical protein